MIIGLLIATTAVAAAVGIASALAFDLQAVHVDQGQAETMRGAELEQKSQDMEAKTLPQQIVELLPGNPFLDFTGARPTSTIAVVIFAAFLGIAYLGVNRKQPEQAELSKKWLMPCMRSLCVWSP
ncbi:L-cystine uptake protein TcyP (plasmid) [Bacillus licheniformis]|nr:L-cystine uptake protein TcyP [Bacillus licheniformis]